MTNFEVEHNAGQHHFEIRAQGGTAVLDYMQNGATIIFTHTGVPSALEGQGLGSKLAQAGLEYARTNKLKVRALCWFVDGYIQRHPEYQDLVT
jgi:predicted GNAT family acetyltransferase